MRVKSARFKTGHFFRKKHHALLVSLIFAGCRGEPDLSRVEPEIPAPDGITVLIELAGENLQTVVPEEFGEVENTSWGRFHVIDQEPFNLFSDVFQASDQRGLLILAVVPEGVELHGTRDHLIIRTGPSGVPTGTEPSMDSGFTAESLWTDPVTAQETLIELIEFFKPDIVLVRLATSESILEIARFWSTRPFVTCIYCSPDWIDYRGFGVFCGKDVAHGVVRGMTPSGFRATVLMVAGLDWRNTGYPAMEPFTRSELE